MAEDLTAGFHERADALRSAAIQHSRDPRTFTYTVENFFHPYVGELIERVNRGGVAGLLDPVFQAELHDDDFFDRYYTRDASVTAFAKDLDVRGGPYANYNWELLFHVPLSIAVHLSSNQRFAEAQRWFHHVFDPTSTDTSVEGPARYWRFLRFRQETDVQDVTDLVALLSTPDARLTPERLEAKRRAELGLGSLRRYPFEPHRVAATRTVAYQYHVVMKYLDNLIAWGDALFREDTAESVDEAVQRYVLAANILGRRPEVLPPTARRPVRSFLDLRAQLQSVGDVLVDLESELPLNHTPAPPSSGAASGSAGTGWVARAPYFCVPRNDRMLAYWDRVEDRLVKIRNSMSIEGVPRQLALFEPAIDPGVLVRAAATGVDLAGAVAAWRTPMGAVRAPTLIRMASEVCADVRNLGAALLAAIEKGDAEALALLRQGHEVAVQERTKDVRFLAWRQTEAATDALLRSRDPALERYHFYQRLLGLGGPAAQRSDVDRLIVDRSRRAGDAPLLTEEGFDRAYAELVGRFDRPYPVQRLPQLKLAEGQSPTAQAGASGTGRLNLTVNEDKELNEHLPLARDLALASSVVDTVASVLRVIPTISVDLHFWGLGLHSDVFGGAMLTEISRIAASILRTTATWEQEQAAMAARTASYERRADEWALQSNLAAHELMQLGRQVLASVVAEQAAHREYLNVSAQIDEARSVDRLLHEKATNLELHSWMQSELTRLYHDHYRFALDLARKAELTVKRELMQPDVDATEFVRGDHWDAGRRGLLAGEGLALDLRRLELAYVESRRREYEIVRHVSVNQLDPLALVRLRETGSCEISIPESLLDLDCPGHYLRRIRRVSVSVPAVTGPYTSVSCALSLLRSSVRTVPTGEPYARQENDARFADLAGAVQTIVTSTGREDDGMFDGQPDDRPLPFEGAGAISTWRIELPHRYRQFDYASIADVVLHVQYTAREGGPQLRRRAEAALDDALGPQGRGLARLFSMRLEFPTQWARFVATTEGRAALAVTLRDVHLPYWAQHHGLGPTDVTLLARGPAGADVVRVFAGPEASAADDTLTRDEDLGLFVGHLDRVPLPPATGEYVLHLDAGQVTDLWMVVTYAST
ncbi:toxin [Actinotalea ferrariae]|uniref:Tc toxin subunit A-related protein n=1 Tax=Actinotalea ferrariae TaxID=1386098 RepID=UPI001C8C4ACA|nr:hypothetical protein [Actinotalea ferrariae]MBX9243733.1 toxin [Actinotalea ferrariae]